MNKGYVIVVALGCLLMSGVCQVEAQGRPLDRRTQLIRDAARLESEGDLAGAEAALRRLVTSDPTSLGGVFALERVLRAQERVQEILPLLDAFLAQQSASEVRGLRLRVLGETGEYEALTEDAESWINEDSRREIVYRLVARAYEPAFGTDRSLEILQRGRSEIGGSSLALDIGDIHAAVGDLDGAVDEWADAVGPNGSEAQTVQARIENLGAAGQGAARRLVGILGGAVEPLRVGAAARMAVELELMPEALELTEQYADGLRGRARSSFLEDIARMAGDSGLAEVSTWSYGALREAASSPGERRQLDQRIADMAMQMGDTAAALQAQRRVAESYDPNSEDGRQARAQVIHLEAGSLEADPLRLSFLAFQADFPEAPELDGLAAAVSAALQSRGDSDGAHAVLQGISGPRSALESAYILLESGDIEGGRSTLLLAVSGLPPSEATPIIQLASLLGRISQGSVPILVTAGVRAHRGKGGEAAEGLVSETQNLAASDRAAVLAEAARMATRSGDIDLSVGIRERILMEYPSAPEVAEATLELARHYAGSGRDDDEAMRLLEELIVRDPGSAVVPEARLELERLRSRGS